jgi:hypothetical protein
MFFTIGYLTTAARNPQWPDLFAGAQTWIFLSPRKFEASSDNQRPSKHSGEYPTRRSGEEMTRLREAPFVASSESAYTEENQC